MEITPQLQEIIKQLISNGAGITVAAWLLARPFMQKTLTTIGDWLQTHIGIGPSEFKRYASLALGTLVALGFYSLGCALNYYTFPGDAEGWLNLLISLSGINFIGTQIVHARRELSQRDAQRKGPAQVKITREK